MVALRRARKISEVDESKAARPQEPHSKNGSMQSDRHLYFCPSLSVCYSWIHCEPAGSWRLDFHTFQIDSGWCGLGLGVRGGGGAEVTATSFVLMVARTDRETETEEPFIPLLRPAVRKN
jgi:hypothetical protein